MKVVNLVDADINRVDLFRWLYHLVRGRGMLYLVEEIFLPLFWLPLLPWQLLLLQSAGCQIFPADLSSHLVFILVNDWSSLIKLTTDLNIIISSPMNMLSDFQRDWLCHFAYVSYSYQKNLHIPYSISFIFFPHCGYLYPI